MKTFLAAAALLGLSACAVQPPVTTGSIMQSGPIDRPIAEVQLPSPGTCQMMLDQLGGNARKISRCTDKSGNLPYGYEAVATGIGKMRISAIDAESCAKLNETMAKKESDSNKVL